jgi:protease I
MKALILTGRMVQDEEYTYPWGRLDEAGLERHVAVRGKQQCLSYSGHSKIKPTHDISEIKVEDYRLLIIPGGVKCMEHMMLDDGAISLIREFHESGGVIGCICSGAMLLIAAGLVKGRKISTYPAWRVFVENAGGEFVNDVVVDDRICTAPHYDNRGLWMLRVLATAGHGPFPNIGWTVG